MSHNALLNNGFDYHFNPGPEYLDDMPASRALFLQYQTYPENTVQGAGTLTAQNSVPGKYWSVFQPAQVIQNFNSILSDLFGGGVDHGIVALQPLIQTTAGEQ